MHILQFSDLKALKTHKITESEHIDDILEDSATEEVDLTKPIYALGRRKTSQAQIYLTFRKEHVEDSPLFTVNVNKKNIHSYFQQPELVKYSLAPLSAVGLLGQKHEYFPPRVSKLIQTGFDIKITAKGGGKSSQSGAVRLGLARVFLKIGKQEIKARLKSFGMLTRDSRMVERKKPGQKKARKKFQWAKR
eukprot:augustus_masked-scaffold_41-processed-gene-2.9-mRNA-1 protein AED:0.43 eAED:0.43 QI:0/-1/0/1/-1/1/1/0/190